MIDLKDLSLVQMEVVKYLQLSLNCFSKRNDMHAKVVYLSQLDDHQRHAASKGLGERKVKGGGRGVVGKAEIT